jgi:CheY-like chemotaxis protein
MKLAALSPELLARAIRIYLSVAWPGREQEKLPRIPEKGAGEALLAVFSDESSRDPAVGSHRYALRLGNRMYPHMKLVLEEYLLPGEFVFTVDTHDEIDLKPDYPDYEAWQDLKAGNRELKSEIERLWREDGVPTYSDLKGLVARTECGGGAGVREAGKILVADDERDIADAVASLLIAKGYDVLLAHDGEQAVTTALRERPDLILMDYQMPRMDGVEACVKIRGAQDRDQCRILLATASLVDLSEVEEADGFLLKPYSKDILLSFIQALLGGK